MLFFSFLAALGAILVAWWIARDPPWMRLTQSFLYGSVPFHETNVGRFALGFIGAVGACIPAQRALGPAHEEAGALGAPGLVVHPATRALGARCGSAFLAILAIGGRIFQVFRE